MKVIFHVIGGLIKYQLSPQPVPINHTYEDGMGTESTKSRKKELQNTIQDFQVFSKDICAPNIRSFIVSYLRMTLNASVGSIEVLAGKAGEFESRKCTGL